MSAKPSNANTQRLAIQSNFMNNVGVLLHVGSEAAPEASLSTPHGMLLASDAKGNSLRTVGEVRGDVKATIRSEPDALAELYGSKRLLSEGFLILGSTQLGGKQFYKDL